jgi:uncharacterized protein
MINSIAGGGTLLSFPALIAIGVNPIVANATNTVALLPGSLAGVLGFRRELMAARRWLFLLIIPSVAGGIGGAFLLLNTPSSTFEKLVPYLILAATILFAAQETIARRLGAVGKTHESPTRLSIVGALLFQGVVAIYGGYFGAGIGILMLAALGLIGMSDLHQMNALKNLFAICINGVAAMIFAFSGTVNWVDAGLMAVGSIIGGFVGARVARRLGRNFVRATVITIGLLMTVVMLLRT